MQEEKIKEYLKNKGWRKRFWQGGSRPLIAWWGDFVTSLESEERTRIGL